MQIVLKDKTIDVVIERKNNKNLYIRVKDDLKMYITCNKYVSEKEIMKIIDNNENSLYKMYIKQEKVNSDSVYYYYLGEKCTLLIDDTIKKPYYDNGMIVVKDKDMLEKFYINECKKVFIDRVNRLKIMFPGIPEFSVRIRKMSTRWGVCNRGNNIVTLNSELIKKDVSLLDYVIVHELSHFYQANHSKLFWQEVEKRYPYYKEARKMLRN